MAKILKEKIIKSGKSDGNWLKDLPTFMQVKKNCFYKLNIRQLINPLKNDMYALILVFNKTLLPKNIQRKLRFDITVNY